MTIPTDPHEIEHLAAKRLDPVALEYFARGSGDGLTLAANIEAWRRFRIRPWVLRDMTTVDSSTSVLGTAIRAPVMVAPMAMQRFACDDGELATARGAATAGAVMVVSMAATCSLEDVAAAAPGAPRWAQMYLLHDRGRTQALAAQRRRRRLPSDRRQRGRCVGPPWSWRGGYAARGPTHVPLPQPGASRCGG